MSQLKLFGKMIPLTFNAHVSDASGGSDHNLSPKILENKRIPAMEEKEKEKEKEEEEEEEETKSDTILACPRCESNDTKFCYFNNYNLNQPRHFCKNCQRHWTAGGAFRNVPVGSGRRRGKNPNPNFNCFPTAPWYPTPTWSSPLGKHPRVGESTTPKTLRIDDPSEVAESSVWATLGAKNERMNLVNPVSVFGGFQWKLPDGSFPLYSNPAAFSRSLRFHERAE